MASLAITTRKLLLETVECLADHFFSPLPRRGNVTHHRPVPPLVGHQLAADEDFPPAELHYTLRTLRRKETTGPDGITNQALRNLDSLMMSFLLDLLNATWRSENIPSE